MKLKLQVEDDVTVLAVTETVDPAQLPVLKAGLNKLFQSEKRLVILDLMAVPDSNLLHPDVVSAILALPGWAKEQAAHLQVVSSAATVATAPSLADAIRALKNPLTKLLLLEAKLEKQLKALEKQKNDISQKVETATAGKSDLKMLRHENSAFKNTVAILEDYIQVNLRKRTQPVTSGALKLKQENLRNLLVTVLEQEGVLAVNK